MKTTKAPFQRGDTVCHHSRREFLGIVLEIWMSPLAGEYSASVLWQNGLIRPAVMGRDLALTDKPLPVSAISKRLKEHIFAKRQAAKKMLADAEWLQSLLEADE